MLFNHKINKDKDINLSYQQTPFTQNPRKAGGFEHEGKEKGAKRIFLYNNGVSRASRFRSFAPFHYIISNEVVNLLFC
jgi:hypothetical protein